MCIRDSGLRSPVASLNTAELTAEKNRLNVLLAANDLHNLVASLNTGEFIWERNHQGYNCASKQSGSYYVIKHLNVLYVATDVQHQIDLLRMLTGWGRVFIAICWCVCFFFSTISQKPMQLGSPNKRMKRGRNMVIFRFSRWRPPHLGFLKFLIFNGRTADRRVTSVKLRQRARFLQNRSNRGRDTWVSILYEFGLQMPIHAPLAFGGFWGSVTP